MAPVIAKYDLYRATSNYITEWSSVLYWLTGRSALNFYQKKFISVPWAHSAKYICISLEYHNPQTESSYYKIILEDFYFLASPPLDCHPASCSPARRWAMPVN